MVECRDVDGTEWWRPLLDVRRATTRQACAAQGLPVWDDPWNTDPAYTRARLRAEVLPLLEEVLGGGVAPGAGPDRAGCCARTSTPWTPWPRPSWRRWDGDLPAADVAALPDAVRRRVLRGWLRAGGVPDVQAVHLHAVDALLGRWRGQGRVDLPGGAGVVRTSGRLVLQPPDGRGSAPRTAADDPEEPLP